jgi:hypothetical protein
MELIDHTALITGGAALTVFRASPHASFITARPCTPTMAAPPSETTTKGVTDVEQI